MKLHVIMRDTKGNTRLICSQVSTIDAKRLNKAFLRSFVFINKDTKKTSEIADQLGHVICNVRKNKFIHNILICILKVYSDNRKYRYIEMISGIEADDPLCDIQIKNINLNEYLPNIKCMKKLLDEI